MPLCRECFAIVKGKLPESHPTESDMSVLALTEPVTAAGVRRRSFDDLSVSVKVLTAVSAAAVVALVVGIMGLVALNNVSNSAQLIYQSNVASIRAVGQLRADVNAVRLDTANQALSI